MSDDFIFESMTTVRGMMNEHVKQVRRELAQELRRRSGKYRLEALTNYVSVEEAARLEGMGDAFAIAAEMVDVKDEVPCPGCTDPECKCLGVK